MRRLVHELHRESKNQVPIRKIDGGMANLTFKTLLWLAQLVLVCRVCHQRRIMHSRRSRVLLEVCMTKKSQIPAQRAPVSNSPGRGQRREDTRAARQAVEVSEGTTGGIEAIS